MNKDIFYIFSYWIYIWFIIYYISNKKIIFSPLFALYIGFIYNIILLIYSIFLYYKNNNKHLFYTIIYFCIINFIIKVIPIIILYNEKIYYKDIIASIILFILYIIYIIIFYDIKYSMNKINNFYINGISDKSPFISYMHYIFNT